MNHPVLWNPKVHYQIHNCPPPVPIPNQLDPFHVATSHFLNIHLILSSHLFFGLPSGLFPSGLTTKTLYTPLLSPMRATCPTHIIHLDVITRKIFGEQYRSLSSSLRSFLHSPVTSSLLGPDILLNTLFTNTLILRFPLQCQRPSFTPIQNTIFEIIHRNQRWLQNL